MDEPGSEFRLLDLTHNDAVKKPVTEEAAYKEQGPGKLARHISGLGPSGHDSFGDQIRDDFRCGASSCFIGLSSGCGDGLCHGAISGLAGTFQHGLQHDVAEFGDNSAWFDDHYLDAEWLQLQAEAVRPTF